MGRFAVAAVLAVGLLARTATCQDMCYSEGSIEINVNTDQTLTSGSVEIVFPDRLMDEDARDSLDQREMTTRLAKTLGVPSGQLLVAFDFTSLSRNNTVTGTFQLLAADALECPVPCFGTWSDWSESVSPCGALDILDGDGTFGNSQRTYQILQPGNELGASCPFANNSLQNGTCCEGHWGEWSECGASCENGTKWRQYNVTVPSSFLGRECPYEHGAWNSTDCIVEEECYHSVVTEGFARSQVFGLGTGVTADQTVGLQRQCTCLWADYCASVSDSDDIHWMCSDDANLYMLPTGDGLSLPELEAWLADEVALDSDMACPDPLSYDDMGLYYDDNDCVGYMSALALNSGSGGACELPASAPELPTGYDSNAWCFWLRFGVDQDNLPLTAFTGEKVTLSYIVMDPVCPGEVCCPDDCEGYWSDSYRKNWTLVDGSMGECLVREYVTASAAACGGEACCDWDFEGPRCPTGYFDCGDGCDWNSDCSLDRVCSQWSGGARGNPYDFIPEKGCSFDIASNCSSDVRGANCTDCMWDVLECPIPCAGEWNATSECMASCEDGLAYRSYWVYREAQFGGAPCVAELWNGSTVEVYDSTSFGEWDYTDSKACSIYDVEPCPFTSSDNFLIAPSFCFLGSTPDQMDDVQASCDALWVEYAVYIETNGYDTTDLVAAWESDSSANASLCWGKMSDIVTSLTSPFAFALGPDFATGANNATCNASTTDPAFCVEIVFPGDEAAELGGSYLEFTNCAEGLETYEYVGYSTYPCSETCCPVECEGSWGDVYLNESCYVRDWVETVSSYCGGTACLYADGYSDYISCATPCAGSWSDWSDCSVSCENGTTFRSYEVTRNAMYWLPNGTFSLTDPYGMLEDSMVCPFDDGEGQTTNCTIYEGRCDEYDYTCGEVTLSYAGQTDTTTTTSDFKDDCLCLWQAKCDALAADDQSSLDYIQCREHLQFYLANATTFPTCGSTSLEDREDMQCFDYMTNLARWSNNIDCGSGIASDPYCVWIRFANEPFETGDLSICSGGGLNSLDAATEILAGGNLIYVGYSVTKYYSDCAPQCCPVDCEGYWADPVNEDCLTQQYVVTQPSVCGGLACNCSCDLPYDADPNAIFFRANPDECTADPEDPDAGITCNLGDCDQDCQGHWEDWSECDAECEDGNRTRTYYIDTPAFADGAVCTCNMTEASMADGNWTCDGWVETQVCRQHVATNVIVGSYDATFPLNTDFTAADFIDDCLAYEQAMADAGCLVPQYTDDDYVYYDENCSLPTFDVYSGTASSDAVLSGEDSSGDPVAPGSLCFFFMRIAESTQPSQVDCPYEDEVGGSTYCLHIAVEDSPYLPLGTSDYCEWEGRSCVRSCLGAGNQCHGGQPLAAAEGLADDSIINFGADGVNFNFYLYTGLENVCCPVHCVGNFSDPIQPTNTTLEGHCNYTVFSVTQNASCGGDVCMYDDGYIQLPSECAPDCEGYWTEWTECNATCELGAQSRMFMITKNATQMGEQYQCEADHMDMEYQACNATFCPNCTFGQLVLTYSGESAQETDLCSNESTWWEFTARPKIADLIGMPRSLAADLLDLISCNMSRGTGLNYVLDVTYERCFECVTQCCPRDCEGDWGNWFKDTSVGNCTSGCDIRKYNVTTPKMCGEYTEADFAGSMRLYADMAWYGDECAYEDEEQWCMDDDGVNHPGSFEEIVARRFVPGYCCNASLNCPVPCLGEWSAWTECDATCSEGVQMRSYTVFQDADEGGANCSFADEEVQSKTCCANAVPGQLLCGSLEFANSVAIEQFDIAEFQCGCELAYLDIFPVGSDDYRGTPTCDQIVPALTYNESMDAKEQCMSKMSLVSGRSFLRLSETCYGQDDPMWCVDFKFANEPNRFQNCTNTFSCDSQTGCPFSSVSEQYFSLYFEVLEPGECGCCPVDCEGEWGQWGTTSDCPARTFNVSVDATCGGTECETIDYKNCQHCEGHWGPWSDCSVSCDSGTTVRSYVVDVEAVNDGDPCELEGETETLECCEMENITVFGETGELAIAFDGSWSSSLTREDLQDECLCVWYLSLIHI